MPGAKPFSVREIRLLDDGAEEIFGGSQGELSCYRQTNGMFVLFYPGQTHCISLTREELRDIDSVMTGDSEACPMLWVRENAARGRVPLTEKSKNGLRLALIQAIAEGKI